MSDSRRGFASFDEDKLREISRKAGSMSNPRKGFGSLTLEERSANGKRAIQIRWDKAREEKQTMAPSTETVDSGEPTNP